MKLETQKLNYDLGLISPNIEQVKRLRQNGIDSYSLKQLACNEKDEMSTPLTAIWHCLSLVYEGKREQFEECLFRTLEVYETHCAAQIEKGGKISESHLEKIQTLKTLTQAPTYTYGLLEKMFLNEN